MTSIRTRMLDRELKKGSAELIMLSIVEPRARHGYGIGKLIEARSAGRGGGWRNPASDGAAFTL